MVMCGKALIDANPAPSRLEIAAAIRNNICRCTGYKKIIDAIAMAADLLRTGQAIPVRGGYRGVGDPCQRINVKAKVLVSASIRMTWMPSTCPACVMAVHPQCYPRAVVKASMRKRPRPCPVSSVS